MTAESSLRYGVAACQVDQPNPESRREIFRNTDRMIEMIDMAVTGYRPFTDVRLIAFPEFGHAAPIYPTAKSLLAKLTVPIPNEHTERYAAKAREFGIYIQTGSFLEEDPKWPGKVFNATCLVGPEGILSKYRKVNPWIPWEVHASPHDLEGVRRGAVPGGVDPDRPDWGCDLLRLDLPRTAAAVDRQRGRNTGSGFRLHGPLGSHPPDGLVDGGQPVSCAGEHGLRHRRKPGSLPAPLRTLLLAGREHGSRFRGQDPGAGGPWSGGENRGDHNRYRGACATSASGVPVTWPSPICAARPIRCTGDPSFPEDALPRLATKPSR